MADFILRKRNDFVFALEEAPDQTFSIPHMTKLDFDDAKLLTQLQEESDIAEQGEMVKGFLQKHAPGLKKVNLGDMEYFEIFKAYTQSVGRSQLGESSASQDS